MRIVIEVSGIYRCTYLPLVFVIEDGNISGPDSYYVNIIDETNKKEIIILGKKVHSTANIKANLLNRYTNE